MAKATKASKVQTGSIGRTEQAYRDYLAATGQSAATAEAKKQIALCRETDGGIKTAVQDTATDNLTWTLDGDVLTIQIDTSKRYHESKSGTSIHCGMTGRALDINAPSGTLKLQVNCYQIQPKRK